MMVKSLFYFIILSWECENFIDLKSTKQTQAHVINQHGYSCKYLINMFLYPYIIQCYFHWKLKNILLDWDFGRGAW